MGATERNKNCKSLNLGWNRIFLAAKESIFFRFQKKGEESKPCSLLSFIVK